MFDDVSAIDEFRSKRVGWISPAGDLIACPTFEHLKVLLGKVERFQELYDQAEDEMNRTLAEEAESDPDGHPAYHRFDSYSEATRGILEEAYESGWIRVGLWNAPMGLRMEATSVFGTLKRNLDRLKFLGDVLGAAVVYRDEFDNKVHQRLGIVKVRRD